MLGCSGREPLSLDLHAIAPSLANQMPGVLTRAQPGFGIIRGRISAAAGQLTCPLTEWNLTPRLPPSRRGHPIQRPCHSAAPSAHHCSDFIQRLAFIPQPPH